MINEKDNNTGKKILINHGELYRVDNLLLTPSFIALLNINNENKNAIDKMDYQDRITSYINRKNECNVRKQYNPTVVSLYEDGIIVINYKEYLLKEFFIVFMDNKNDFHIKCTNKEYKNEDYEYNRAVKFIDTTAFINLIKSDKVLLKNNKLIISDNDILNNVVNNWDGMLHSETKETDAIINKKMIEDEDNE